MIFTLDTRLKNTSFNIIDLPLCEVRLKDNRHFPWCILIPKVNDITEIFQLSDTQQSMLIHEIALVSRVMQSHFSPAKMNVAALGNIVSQLHLHVIARFENDLCWPHSIWQADLPEKSYDMNEANKLIDQLRKGLLQGCGSITL